MKNIITLCVALMCSFFSYSQFGGYEIEIFQEDYNDLVDPIEISDSSEVWDDPAFGMPIGFQFDLLGIEIDTLNTAGLVGGGVLNTPEYYGFDESAGFLFYFADLIDRAAVSEENSPISFITEGEPGSRIFKLEYKNAGFFAEVSASNTAENFVNVQLWLHESDGSWESRTGPNNIIDPSNIFDYDDGPVIGLVKLNADNLDFAYLVNDQVNPPVLDSVGYYSDIFGIQPPEENTVIRFSKFVSGVKSPEILTGISLHPSLASNEVKVDINNESVDLSDTQIKIYDLTGRTFYRINSVNTNQISVPVHHLSSGQYYLSVQSKAGHKTLPFVKQ